MYGYTASKRALHPPKRVCIEFRLLHAHHKPPLIPLTTTTITITVIVVTVAAAGAQASLR